MSYVFRKAYQTASRPPKKAYSRIAGPGWHELKVENCTRETSSSGSDMLVIEFSAFGDSGVCETHHELLNLWHPTEMAREISMQALSDIGRALLGRDGEIQDTGELVGKCCKALAVQDGEYRGVKQYRIKVWKSAANPTEQKPRQPVDLPETSHDPAEIDDIPW